MSTAEQEIIDSRVNDLWNDKDAICKVISDNFDELAALYNTEGDMKKAIDGYLETMVREDLNL